MRRSLVIMCVLFAVLFGLTACGTSSSKGSTTTKSTPSSATKAGNAQRAKARLEAHLICLGKHGVKFKTGTKVLTPAEIRAEPKYVAAVAICKVPAKVTPTTKSAG